MRAGERQQKPKSMGSSILTLDAVLISRALRFNVSARPRSVLDFCNWMTKVINITIVI